MSELTTENSITTAKDSSRSETAPQSFEPGPGRDVVPSEGEIRGLFISDYRDADPRCAILVRQIILCHRAKNNSSERRKIIEAIKAGKEWQRIAPTWEKFVRRALARSVFATSHEIRKAPADEAVPDPVQTDHKGGSVAPVETDLAITKTSESNEVALAEINLECAIRVREKFNQEVVDRYCELMKAGVSLPPIKVFRVSGVLKVTDGQHRCRAAKKAGFETIKAIIVEGSEQDALKDALSANAQHGLPRSNKDKRRVAILGIQNFGHLSDRAIAEICQVSNTFIGEMKAELSAVDSSEPRTGRDGKSRRQPKRKSNPTESSADNDQSTAVPPAATQECMTAHEPSFTDSSSPATSDEKHTGLPSREDNDPEDDRADSVDAIWKRLTAILEPRIGPLTKEDRMELAVRLASYADSLCESQPS